MYGSHVIILELSKDNKVREARGDGSFKASYILMNRTLMHTNYTQFQT